MAINIDEILQGVNDLSSSEKADFSNLVFESYPQDESFPQHHRFDTGVRANTAIPIMNSEPNYGFLKVSQGNCESNPCSIDTTSSLKKWNPVPYDCRIEICKQDFSADFKKFWNMHCTDLKDPNDALVRYIIAKANEDVNASNWRGAYFDDSEDENSDYAGIDGLFKQMLATAPVGSPNRFVIDQNDGETIAEQMALDPETAYELFRDMYDYAALYQSQILSDSGVHFDVTPELAHNYLKYIRENKEVQCCLSINGSDGITKSKYSIENLNYMGVPIYVRNEWAGVIRWKQKLDGADNYDNPHRAVLTYTNNKPIGTCDMASFETFDLWYERKDKKLYIDVGTTFDAKIILDNDFVLGM